MINYKEEDKLIIGTNFGRVFSISCVSLKLSNQYLFKDGANTSVEMNI
jgi:hypothetical protein